jgi:hypothetical protein
VQALHDEIYLQMRLHGAFVVSGEPGGVSSG